LLTRKKKGHFPFFTIKPTRRTKFPNLLWHEALHVSGSSSAHHQESIYCTFGTGICHTGLKTAFEQDQDGTAEELPETCRASFQSKFGNLVRLVAFIVKVFVTLHGHMNVKFATFLVKVSYLCKSKLFLSML